MAATFRPEWDFNEYSFISTKENKIFPIQQYQQISCGSTFKTVTFWNNSSHWFHPRII